MNPLSPSALRQARRLAPFAAATLLPYALLALPPAHWQAGQVLLSFALLVALGLAVVLVPWVRLASWTHILPPLGYLAALAVLRHAGNGTTGVGVLVLLPVFWLALYGTRAHLAVMLLAALAFFVLPSALVGGPAHPAADLRIGMLFTVVAGVVGVTVQGLMARMRAHGREREALLAHLAELAYTDALTGLPNRRAWTAALEGALALADETGEALTVAMLDLDNFKAVNDSRGHEYGDALLAESAAGWRERLRPTDMIARLGGDEFAILLPGCGAGEAPQVLERVLEPDRGAAAYSVGFAEWDRRRSASALLGEADRALYAAKRAGRPGLVGTA